MRDDVKAKARAGTRAKTGAETGAETGADGGAETGVEALDRELVRLAYFILPGKGKRIYRLAVARRIVDGTGSFGLGSFGAGVSGGGAERRRDRVLRRAMRPSRRLQIGLGPWLRAMPSRLPDPSFTIALSKLETRVRVAYVLLYVAGMPRYAVRDRLVAIGVSDPQVVIDAAVDASEQGRVPGSAGPRRPGPDPFARARPRPIRNRTPVPIGVAVVLTAVLLGALVVSEGHPGTLTGGTSSADAQAPRLVSPAPDAWTRGRRTLDVWPARGDLTGDKAFTGRALKVWAAAEHGRAGSAGDPQLLFAGRVDGRRVALLRRGDRLGRYTGPSGPLTVSTVDADPAAPMAVGGGRYLIAPWERAESLAGARVTVRHGVTGLAAARTRCGRGPVLHLKGDGKARTVGEFGGPRPVVLTHRPPTYTYQAASSKKTQAAGPVQLKGEALRVWERVACHAPRPSRPVTRATAWEFWSGVLPEGGGRAQWVCTGMAFADGGTVAQSALLDRKGAHGTGWCDDRRPVAGGWWRSPGGEWRYLAAAAQGLTPRADGPFAAPGEVTARLLTAVPARPERGPAGPVHLTARPSRQPS